MPLHRLFFYVTVFLLPTQLGKHFWPEWSMLLGRRIDYLSPTFFVTDITIFLTCFFFLMKNGERIMKNERKGKHILIGLGVLVLFAVVNIFFSASPPVSFFSWMKLFECLFVIWYIMKDKPLLSVTSYLLFLGVFYSSLIAIAQFFLQHSVGGPLWFIGERTFSMNTPGIARTFLDFSSVHLLSDVHWPMSTLILRPYATFPHPNVLGGFLAVVLPLLFFARQTVVGSKIVFYIGIGIGCIALLLTFSKTALVAFFLSVLTYVWKNLKKRKLITAGAAMLSIMFILGWTTMSSTTTIEESIQDRVSLQTSAMKIFHESPFVGVGLNTFLVRLPEVTRVRKVFSLQPVHSVYMVALTEVGSIGIVLFLFFLIKIFPFWQKRKNDQIVQILTFSMLELLFLGLFDHYLLTSQQGRLLTAILLGFLLEGLIRNGKSVSV